MNLVERANLGLHLHVAETVMQTQPDHNATILDVGCGTGALLNRLVNRGYVNLIGVDIAPPEGGSPGIRFLQSDLDACRLPLTDGSVDLVLSVEVFEHVENLGSLMRELARVLKIQGTLLMTTPNVHSLEARLRYLLLGSLKQFDAIGDPTHITPIFLFPFARLLRRHGFYVSATWGFPTDGSSPTSRGALRWLARLLRLCGLRGGPPGDQLCLRITKVGEPAATEGVDKRAWVTAHY